LGGYDNVSTVPQCGQKPPEFAWLRQLCDEDFGLDEAISIGGYDNRRVNPTWEPLK
jgi:hypothetical protein